MIRRILLALTAVALLSGCAAGTDSVSLKQYTPTDGNSVQSGSIKVRNLLIVASEDGNGTVYATIINSSDATDRLQGMTVNSLPVQVTADSLDLAQNTPLIFGGESATATATVALPVARPGQNVSVVMSFEKAGLVETTALVREATLEFAP